jgi:ribosomal protein S27E
LARFSDRAKDAFRAARLRDHDFRQDLRTRIVPSQDQSPPATVQDHRFPCPTSGADYRFAPGDGLLICDHCGHSEAIAGGVAEAPAIRELDYNSALAADLPDSEIEETRVSKCPNCAAQVEFDADTHATECPFCATPVVTDTGAHRHIKPRGVLPFALTEREANRAMTDWLGKLWFAPNGLQEYARKGRRMDGIYVPYWT